MEVFDCIRYLRKPKKLPMAHFEMISFWRLPRPEGRPKPGEEAALGVPLTM